MSVDVSYHGVPLAHSAVAKADGDAAIVEIDAPMPVGTWLEVKTGGVTVRARVLQVNEGTHPGMTLRFADGKTLPPEAFVVPPSEKTLETPLPEMMAREQAEPNAPMAEMTSAPKPVIEADASRREPTAEMVAEDARQTAEMPVITMDAIPEDESSSPGVDEDAPKDDDNGGGRRKKRRPRKTVIGR